MVEWGWLNDLWHATAATNARKMCIIVKFIHIRSRAMRTNIDIDDELMAAALAATGVKTKREAVELGLKTVIRLNQQEKIRQFRGKLHWEGDLDEMRTDR